jgi:hypothetical protein
MGKLNNQDIAAIRECYLKGQSSDYIGNQFGISGQRVRQLVKENDWKALRSSTAPTKIPAGDNGSSQSLVLLQAKQPENYGRRNEITKAAILHELGRGVNLTAAARAVGLRHDELRQWRYKDSELDLQCHTAQADFISKVETLAGEVSTPREALALLGRHPLTKSEWTPQEEKNSIKIEFSFTREDRDVIDADFKEVPQIEGN